VSVTLDTDGIATVTFSRPPNNFFDHALLKSLADALERLDDPATCRAVVLRSEGRHFCAGARLEPSNRDPAGARIYDEAIRLFRVGVPIVAACQGSTVGGGLGLALVADFRVGAPSSRFSANFTRLGFHPGFGISHTLPRIAGEQHASRMLLTGEKIDGERALAIGLLDELVAEDAIAVRAHALATKIAAAAPLAVRSVRSTLRADRADEVERALRHERQEQQRLMATEDFREGIKATAEHRQPAFRAR